MVCARESYDERSVSNCLCQIWAKGTYVEDSLVSGRHKGSVSVKWGPEVYKSGTRELGLR